MKVMRYVIALPGSRDPDSLTFFISEQGHRALHSAKGYATEADAVAGLDRLRENLRYTAPELLGGIQFFHRLTKARVLLAPESVEVK